MNLVESKRPAIFITLGEPFVVRNIFATAFWKDFLKQWGGKVTIVILADTGRAEFYRQSLGSSQVIFEKIEPRFQGRFASIVASLARSAVKSHTNLWSKMRSWARGDSTLAVTLFKRVHTFLLGDLDWYKRFLRRLILLIKPAPELAELYDKYKPKLIIETSITNFDFDVPIAAEARRRGIRILGITRGWDNFTSHGMLRVVPDKILVQNKFLTEMAEKYQAIDPKKIEMEVIGIPHYDWYRNLEKFLEPREKFFARLGLDPQKRLILYGAMGDFLFPNEGGVANVFEELISSGKIKELAQVLFREHPKFSSPLGYMENMRHVRPDQAGEDAHLLNSLYHCDVLVTGASTMAIDGAAVDKPVVCVAFDGTSKDVPYWFSVKRFYDTYTHFEELLKSQGVRVVDTPDKLAMQINAYFTDPSRDKEGRKKIVERFIAPFDGRAAERLGQAISRETGNLLRN